MFIESVPNRTSPPAVLLRESYRDDQGRAQKRTLANLSKLPGDVVDGLKALLKGGTVIGTGPDEMRIARSLPHGHVAAVLGTLRRIALDRLILSTANDAASRRHCDLVVAMIVDRLIAPRSKLGFVRAVDEETASTTLGAVLRLRAVKEWEAYEALDWLLSQRASRTAWRDVICMTACWCSMMLAHRISRAAVVRWHSTATAGIIVVIGHRSSTGCYAPGPGCRLQSRCSKAMPPIPRR